MKIVCFKTCPYAHKALTILKLKNVDCEVEFIEKNNKPDWFLKLSPEGKVPLLIIDEQNVIFESDAILEYIEETYEPKCMVEDNITRAKHRALNYMVSSYFGVFFKIFEATTEDGLNKAIEPVCKALTKIEDMLKEENKYFAGQELSFGDIALFVFFVRLNILENDFGFNITQNLPKISKLKQNLLQTKLTETLVSDFKQEFIKKYKKDNSYICK